MKRQFSLRATILAFAIATIWSSAALFAQGQKNAPNTKSPILYHGGRVMVGSSNVYLIWYGCWDSNCGINGSVATKTVLEDLSGNIGSTPYFVMNATYTNDYGQGPSGALLFGGSAYDANYSRGKELTEDDIKAIAAAQIDSNGVPYDPAGIYVIIASADVGSTATGLCTTVGTPPLHGTTYSALGALINFGFLGNPNRCPAIAGPQFVGRTGNLLPTPNGDFAADVMVSDFAHLADAMVTNPDAKGGWYDKYGLENADKCTGTFGTTFTTANGARANVTWGGRSYLIQQNWVNDKKGRCDMQLYHF